MAKTPLETANQFKSSGPFTASDAKRKGLTRVALYRLVKEGKIKKLSKGLFLHPNAKVDYDTLDFTIAQATFGPKAVIGGLTALFEYRLIEQVPQQTWVLVPPTIRSKNRRYRVVRTRTSPRIGVDDHGSYRMTSIERTLIESLRYAKKIGLSTAFKAIRTALVEKKTTHAKLSKMAKDMDLLSLIARHWEAIES